MTDPYDILNMETEEEMLTYGKCSNPLFNPFLIKLKMDRHDEFKKVVSDLKLIIALEKQVKKNRYEGLKKYYANKKSGLTKK